jgi:hypothetical protein
MVVAHNRESPIRGADVYSVAEDIIQSQHKSEFMPKLGAGSHGADSTKYRPTLTRLCLGRFRL